MSADPSVFDLATPPAEWLEMQRRSALVQVATAAIGPVEPSRVQREHSAMAQTLLWFGARIEKLEKRNIELEASVRAAHEAIGP